MHFSLPVALLLCGSAVTDADAGPSIPEYSLYRPEERFVVEVQGETGAQIDVREVVTVGRHCSFTTTTKEGAFVLMDILVRDGEEKGKKLLELKLVEFPTAGPANVVSFSDDLAPGESNICGDGWNNLFKIKLATK
jgi:hypothetical protein